MFVHLPTFAHVLNKLLTGFKHFEAANMVIPHMKKKKC